MSGYDISAVPDKFYKFYCLFVSLQLFLISVYALCLFVAVKNFKTKLLLLWLVIAETTTLIDHLLRKYVLTDPFNSYQLLITLVVFLVCCSFVILRAYKKLESDKFKPGRTYIVNFLPKDFKGLINYLFTCSGHKAIYQDGFLYGFSKKTGAVIQKTVSPEDLMQSYLKEIPRIATLNSLIGKRFNLLTFNCNQMVNHAMRRS